MNEKTTKKAWYLGHGADDVGEAAILIGDPDRIDRIAEHLTDPVFLPVKRGLRTITGHFQGIKVTAASFGMGAPIATIVMSELADLGVSQFIRVGTAMYFPPAEAANLLVSEAVQSFEGTSGSYTDDADAGRASMRLNRAISAIVERERQTACFGRFATFDAFYRDMFPLDEGSVSRVQNKARLLAENGNIAADMETSALVNAALYLGVDFTSICVATVNGENREKLSPDVLAPRENTMFDTALKALTRLSREEDGK